MAETYHIYDYKRLKGRYLATLVLGLRPNSRLKMKLANIPVELTDILLARVCDEVAFMASAYTKGNNKPKSILEAILKLGEERRDKVTAFNSAEEFEEARRKIIERS